MKHQTKLKPQSGFTIIEILVVMILAASILVIVFLVVPSTQRNSRNNAAVSDAASVITAVKTYITQNDGGLPNASGSQTGPDITVSGAGTSTTAKVSPSTQVLFSSGGCGATTLANNVIGAYFDCKCKDDHTTNVAATKSFSVLYSIEVSGSTNEVRCIDGYGTS